MGPSILSVPGYTGYSYLDDPESILALVVLCPLCLCGEVEHQLVRDGGYPRWIPTTGGQSTLGRIYRKWCSRCGVSFSLLPDFIPKGLRYSCLLVADWLWEALKGTSCRSRAFLERHEVPVPDEEPGQSWTYLLDSARTQPGYQLLARWVTRFSARALTALPTLMTACIVLGCDLRAEADRFSGMVSAPARAFPIAVALYLWSAMRGTGEELERQLPSLVHYLLWHRRGSSHERRRAWHRASRYDGLAVTGRAPPPATSLQGGST